MSIDVRYLPISSLMFTIKYVTVALLNMVRSRSELSDIDLKFICAVVFEPANI